MGVGNFWSDRQYMATDVTGKEAIMIGSMGMIKCIFSSPLQA
jgi:hypothetical protein